MTFNQWWEANGFKDAKPYIKKMCEKAWETGIDSTVGDDIDTAYMEGFRCGVAEARETLHNYSLVPSEPTKAQLKAAWDLRNDPVNGSNASEDIYKVMLKAAKDA